jgi:hypothetical protein
MDKGTENKEGKTKSAGIYRMFTRGENGRKAKVKRTGRTKTYSLEKTSPFWLPRGLRRRSAGARLQGMRVRNRPGVWMSFYYECCILSGRGLCDGLIPRLEKFCPLYLSVF